MSYNIEANVYDSQQKAAMTEAETNERISATPRKYWNET